MPEQTPLRLSFRQAPSGVDFAARVAEIAAFPAQTLLVATGDGPVRLEVEEAMVSIPEAEPGPGGRLVFDIERREGRNRVVEIKLIEPSGERAVFGLRGEIVTVPAKEPGLGVQVDLDLVDDLTERSKTLRSV